MAPVAGAEHVIAHGRHTAAICDVGATLRRFTSDGVDVLDGFGRGEVAPDGRGQVLAPFPNRLEDGAYVFEGVSGAVAWNEPQNRNAIHGLVRWLEFTPIAVEPTRVSLVCVLAAQPAYPFRLRLEMTYSLRDAGLEVAFAATNLDDRRAPFGIGFHPYLAAGPGGVDAARVELAAGERLELDGRGLPIGSSVVAGSQYARLTDGSAPIGALPLDDCFTSLVADASGVVRTRFERGDGRVVELVSEPLFGYLMCFSGDTLAPERQRRAIAIEPMTCPPNALRSGRDLLVLEPGAEVGGRFSIEPSS